MRAIQQINAAICGAKGQSQEVGTSVTSNLIGSSSLMAMCKQRPAAGSAHFVPQGDQLGGQEHRKRNMHCTMPK
jgi:glycerol dehydrogenase-like iron-containing ADH family enzyme